MEDVCVRPDTVLAGLLLRTRTGASISQEEIDASDVRKAAASALRSAAGAPSSAPATKAGGQAGSKKGTSGPKTK